MANKIKSVSGLGFGVYRVEDDESSNFPCSFHKLDEERDAHPCPEAPYVFISWTHEEDGYSFCKRHFALFAGDMHVALKEFGREVEGIDTDPHAIVQDGSVITRANFTEIFMDAKDMGHGGNA
jgi:hypothetical protein